MDIILETKNLVVEYENINNKKLLPTRAVDGVSLKIQRGEIYAMAGESGCGKSSFAKAVMRLIKPKSGEILFNNKDIYKMSRLENKKYPSMVQMIFQNPYSSLNPKMRIEEILREPLDINTRLNKSEKEDLIDEVLTDTGLSLDVKPLYPHQFSGGQRQRIAIARALILNPKLIIADEPVSALDASIQAQILNLLKELKQKRDLTIIFISHDMNVINFIADRIGIMNKGCLIEENYTGTLLKYPKEDYTKQLISAVPVLKV